MGCLQLSSQPEAGTKLKRQSWGFTSRSTATVQNTLRSSTFYHKPPHSLVYAGSFFYMVFIIGIKDLFECFMMVLNYRSAEY